MMRVITNLEKGDHPMSNERLTVKISIDAKYKNVLDFYSKNATLTKFFNIVLDEIQRNKSLKFKLLKDIQNSKT